MVYIIHKILVLLKITNLLECFLRVIITKSLRLEEYKKLEENIIKDVRNLFKLSKLGKKANDATIKQIINLFRLKKEHKVIKKGSIIRDVWNLF